MSPVCFDGDAEIVGVKNAGAEIVAPECRLEIAREGKVWKANVFTARHGMQTQSSDDNSVCLSVRPSVRLSVTRANCDKTVERSVQIYIPYERSFSLVL